MYHYDIIELLKFCFRRYENDIINMAERIIEKYSKPESVDARKRHLFREFMLIQNSLYHRNIDEVPYPKLTTKRYDPDCPSEYISRFADEVGAEAKMYIDDIGYCHIDASIKIPPTHNKFGIYKIQYVRLFTACFSWFSSEPFPVNFCIRLKALRNNGFDKMFIVNSKEELKDVLKKFYEVIKRESLLPN